jgi:hypothetical protein
MPALLFSGLFQPFRDLLTMQGARNDSLDTHQSELVT